MRARPTTLPGRPSRIRRAAIALAVSALAALTLAGCSSEEKDERAYPGSPAGQSLETVLKRFELQLPSCDVEGLGFSGSSRYPEEKLSLSFRAPKPCVDKFLREHGAVDVEKPFHWPTQGADSPQDSYFLEEDSKRFGWEFDHSRQYDVHRGFHTSNGSLFKVLVDPRGTTETVYMQSTFVGGS